MMLKIKRIKKTPDMIPVWRIIISALAAWWLVSNFMVAVTHYFISGRTAAPSYEIVREIPVIISSLVLWGLFIFWRRRLDQGKNVWSIDAPGAMVVPVVIFLLIFPLAFSAIHMKLYQSGFFADGPIPLVATSVGLASILWWCDGFRLKLLGLLAGIGILAFILWSEQVNRMLSLAFQGNGHAGTFCALPNKETLTAMLGYLWKPLAGYVALSYCINAVRRILRRHRR